MNNLVVAEHVLRLRDQFRVELDAANGYLTASGWTALAADAGASVALTDGSPPYVLLTTGGVDNNEALLRSQVEAFLFANSRPIKLIALVRFAEAATNAANVFVGFADAAGADLLVDNGGGPKASFSGAYFFKVDGNVNWFVGNSVGATNSETELTAVNSHDKKAHVAGSTAYQFLEIDINPVTANWMTYTFSIDGVRVYQQTEQVYASATEMHAAIYVKAGGATSETVRASMAAAYQKR